MTLTDLAPLLEHDDAHLLSFLLLELFEAYGGAETRWAAADDADVDLV